MLIYIDLIIAVVGLIVYFATNTKAAQAGLYAFACGLLALLLAVGMHGVRVP